MKKIAQLLCQLASQPHKAQGESHEPHPNFWMYQ